MEHREFALKAGRLWAIGVLTFALIVAGSGIACDRQWQAHRVNMAKEGMCEVQKMASEGTMFQPCVTEPVK